MKPKRIILVRHGESIGNADLSVYQHTPDYALDLTRLGQEQAWAAGAQVADIIGHSKVKVYVSPWKRTRLTYNLIAEKIRDRIVDKVEDPLIREQEWGHFSSPEELIRINEERNRFGQFYYRVPNGESGSDVYTRMSLFLDSMNRDFQRPEFPDNALIVSHGMAIRVFLCRFFKYSVEFFETIENPDNAEVIVIEQNSFGTYTLKTPLRFQHYKDCFEMAI